jgi:hypothetical protein
VGLGGNKHQLAGAGLSGLGNTKVVESGMGGKHHVIIEIKKMI